MPIAVDVDGVKNALDRFLFDLQSAGAEVMAESLHAAEGAALSAIKAQTRRRTGELEDKLVTVQQSPTRGRLFNTAGHAQFINDGTAPHKISAKNARSLMFQRGGQTFFRRVVNHPGTKPRPFIPQAMAAGEQALFDGLQRRVEVLSARF